MEAISKSSVQGDPSEAQNSQQLDAKRARILSLGDDMAQKIFRVALFPLHIGSNCFETHNQIRPALQSHARQGREAQPVD